MTDPLRTVVKVARGHGLPTSDPLVLRDLTNLIVHLRPAPVVARVQLTLGALRGRAWAETEIDAALFLAPSGCADRAAGPRCRPRTARGGRHARHLLAARRPRSRARRAVAAGRSLRELHDAFAAYEGELPTCDRLSEVRGLVVDPELRALAERLPPLEGAPIHGDAHLRNVLWSPRGPLWSDLENICRGPREFDLACLRFRPLPESDAAIAAYGDHDGEEIERALMYVTLFLAAVTPLVAERAGDEGKAEAQRRIERALGYARAP